MSKNKNELPLSEKCIKIWTLRATLLLICFWFICGAAAAFSYIISVVLAVLSVAAYLFAILFYFRLMYSHCSYKTEKNGITICKGILISRVIYIDRSRLQYSELVQSPLQRIFKTCTIVYQTAGAVIRLSQIDVEKANGAMLN